MRSRAERRQAYQAGAAGEFLASLWLRAKGYRIIERRYRTGRGEIDLVARRGGLLAFVEVKNRKKGDVAADQGDLVSRRQQARIMDAAALYLADHPALSGLDVRFDVILVRNGRWPRHMLDVWRPV